MFKFCAVIMPVSIFFVLFKILWLLMAFFIKPHVLIHFNKMGWLSKRINILLKQLMQFESMVRFLNIFWGDVVLIACYFINRMSSLVINNKIPHSILFCHEPLHVLPPQVFGSTCFVHNYSPGLINSLLGHTNVVF